jgi:hypothetical protein
MEMHLTHYGFLVKAPGYAPETHRTALVAPSFTTRIVGVSNVEQALVAARQLVEEGIQMIELCGGFYSS